MKQYIVDAFTDKLFSGNQAAVCVMDEWISDALMQNIAIENNLSETAFVVQEGAGYHLRWFTPGGEIDFCGHATLATAFVLFTYHCKDAESIHFHTQVGSLVVKHRSDLFEMDFPVYRLNPVAVTEEMEIALGVRPKEAYLDRDLLLVLDNEEAVKQLHPDIEKLEQLPGLCIGVTARGADYDCVSRVFAPKLKIAEDPVTGSTHCMIIPFWAERLGKKELDCLQASARSGVLHGELDADRVRIAGKAVLYSIAELYV